MSDNLEIVTIGQDVPTSVETRVIEHVAVEKTEIITLEEAVEQVLSLDSEEIVSIFGPPETQVVAVSEESKVVVSDAIIQVVVIS